MRACALLCLLSAAAARGSLAAPADDRSADMAPISQLRPSRETGGAASQPSDDRSADMASLIQPRPSREAGGAASQPAAAGLEGDTSLPNPNGIFGNSCPEGFARRFRECVRIERPQPPRRVDAPPSSAGGDDGGDGDDDLGSLGGNNDDFLKSLGIDDDVINSLGTPAAPAIPTPSTTLSSPTATLSVEEFVDSLSDADFLAEVLRGAETAATPTLTPTSTPCVHGTALVAVGSVLLLAALALAVWVGLRWRARRTVVSV